jgi:hypothetical protein
MVLRKVDSCDFNREVTKYEFVENGCRVEMKRLEMKIDDRTSIQRNYDMITNEQKAMILEDERFGKYEEMLAVAALKRRLDFFEDKSATYEAALFSIETEQVGRGLKIKWRFKPELKKKDGYDIVGFRRTGGFFSDPWDETNNGTQVVHSSSEGETVELLNEGQAQFYTFFLKPYKEDAKHPRCSPVRFQITIATKAETEAIRTALDRIDRRSLSPSPTNVSAALRELGLYAEFDHAIEQRRKVMEGQIETSRCTREEKEEKLSRLRDVVASVRDKYQQ